jgi:diaminohydroxyphosphoribosylaminopyrimidine deaminase/5-amino-6-(5-phosphoribosylamino)uracil reductase
MAGAGYHQRKGEPHAEVHALAAAGSRARGGTAVVTLEPCNHVGITPACRQALVDAGIVRVVISLIDPTSRGDGGAAVLAAAGVDVEIGLLADKARIVLEPWLTATRRRSPFVTWAYDASNGATGTLGATCIADLRQQNDAVMLPDGTLEEGIPGGHGADRLRLPDAIASHTDPSASLKVLFEGGVRTLLVVDQSPLAQALDAVAALDRVVAHVRRAPEVSASITRPASMLPDGFQLMYISTAPDTVRLFARRIPQNVRPSS